MQGNRERGKTVFARVCASCHQLAGVGHPVGPSLSALTDTSPQALLTAVLDPNREVDARYASYSAVLKDGRVLSGLIQAETASAITLKRQDGQADVILRTELEEIKTLGRSLMPEGIENDLKPDELADLFALIGGERPQPKSIDGNQPRTILPNYDGSIELSASAASVYGPSLTFEREPGNLGYWHSDGDRASWTFHLEKAARFTMSLQWACADESAGSSYEIEVASNNIRGVIGSTGSWSKYQSMFVAELSLPPGDHKLEMRSAGPIRIALADVRAITLVPFTAGFATERSPRAEVKDLARKILDISRPDAERESLIRQHPDRAVELVAAMTFGLNGDRAEESRRIPSIWRVAIEIGRRNDPEEVRRLLAIALPRKCRTPV